MKQIVWVMMCMACTMACKEQGTNETVSGVEEKVENYGTGEKSRTYTRINGKIEGKMTDYYPSGKLKAERWFANNLQQGKTVIYYENSQIKEVQYYDKGKRQHGDTLYYESGTIQFVSEFADDKKNGYLRKWDEAGALIYEARFAMDSLVEVNGQTIRK